MNQDQIDIMAKELADAGQIALPDEGREYF
jgi:hypothetical protein